MYYAICNSGVYSSDSLKKLNNMLNGAQLDEDEFTCLGSDKIVKLSDNDIDFIQDKRKMSRIFFGNFFREDKTQKLFTMMGAIFSILTFLILLGK